MKAEADRSPRGCVKHPQRAALAEAMEEGHAAMALAPDAAVWEQEQERPPRLQHTPDLVQHSVKIGNVLENLVGNH